MPCAWKSSALSTPQIAPWKPPPSECRSCVGNGCGDFQRPRIPAHDLRQMGIDFATRGLSGPQDKCLIHQFPTTSSLPIFSPSGKSRFEKSVVMQLCHVRGRHDCILETCPTSAESAQISLLCCQPEPVSGASTVQELQLTLQDLHRLSARQGASICIHNDT